MSFFYSFVARTIDMDFSASAPKAGMLTPYAAFFLFVVGTFLSTFALNPVSPRKYFGGGRAHLAGFSARRSGALARASASWRRARRARRSPSDSDRARR